MPLTNQSLLSSNELNLSELRMSIEDSDLSNAEKAHELKALFLQEVQQRKLNDETYKELQKEYNTLLKKFAEAENTIDELRVGAKVNLIAADSPVPQAGQAVPPASSQKPTSKLGYASLSSMVMGTGKNSVSGTTSTVQGTPSLSTSDIFLLCITYSEPTSILCQHDIRSSVCQ